MLDFFPLNFEFRILTCNIKVDLRIFIKARTVKRVLYWALVRLEEAIKDFLHFQPNLFVNINLRKVQANPFLIYFQNSLMTNKVISKHLNPLIAPPMLGR